MSGAIIHNHNRAGFRSVRLPAVVLFALGHVTRFDRG